MASTWPIGHFAWTVSGSDTADHGSCLSRKRDLCLAGSDALRGPADPNPVHVDVSLRENRARGVGESIADHRLPAEVSCAVSGITIERGMIRHSFTCTDLSRGPSTVRVWIPASDGR